MSQNISKHKDITLSPIFWEYVESRTGQNRSKQMQGIIATEIIGFTFNEIKESLAVIPKCYRRNINRAYFDKYIEVAEFLTTHQTIKWARTSLQECIFTMLNTTTNEIRYITMDLMRTGPLLELFWDRELDEKTYSNLEYKELLIDEGATWLDSVASGFRKDLFRILMQN